MSLPDGEPPSHDDPSGQTPHDESSSFFMAALSVGVIGAVSALVGGALCPVCVVAAPALVGAGAYKRWRAKRPSQAGARG